MKQYILPSLKLTLIMILLCSVAYPLAVAGLARLAPGQGKGETIKVEGKVVGYANVGQKFSSDEYFNGRPSGVDYNAGGSGGSNKGPSNPDYLQLVQGRIDSFLVHNPAVSKKDIPAEMVTASGSGLDPDISRPSALVQVKRIAAIRKTDEKILIDLIDRQLEKPFAGMLGPSTINVLKLNIALDALK